MKLFKNLMIVLSAALLIWSCSDDESINGGNSEISLSTNIIQVDKNGGDATVTVKSSDEWRLSGVCEWAHPSVTSGKNGDIVTFTIDPNILDEKRTATFKFFTGSAVVPLQIESQPAYIMNLLSDEVLSISKERNTIKIQLETNIANPTITFSDGGEEWLAFDKRSEFGGKVTLSFTASKNDTYINRVSNITITSPLVAEAINVNVNQKQTDALILESNSLMYDLSAQKISLKVKYNIDYNIAVTQGSDWITNQSISDPQKGDDGLSTVIITYELTEALSTRGGTISIAKTDNTFKQDISVIQKEPNVEIIQIPDTPLRTYCIAEGWVLSVSGPNCIVLNAGQEATSMDFDDYHYGEINDLTGIENFPNLTSLNIGDCTDIKKIDISGLHKVSELLFGSTYKCEEYNLGDNPIISFNTGDEYSYSDIENIKVISSKVESLNLSIDLWYGEYYDSVVSIDVSECPALKTLNANRGSKTKTLYLKKGQSIPNLIKNDATEIVYK